MEPESRSKKIKNGAIAVAVAFGLATCANVMLDLDGSKRERKNENDKELIKEALCEYDPKPSCPAHE